MSSNRLLEGENKWTSSCTQGVHYDIISGTEYSYIKKMPGADRKNMPVYTGVMKYFPNAIKYVSKISQAGNDQHHPEKPLLKMELSERILKEKLKDNPDYNLIRKLQQELDE